MIPIPRAPAAPTTQAATGAATGVATAPRTEVRREALAQGLYELAHSARQNAVFVASSGGFGPTAAPSRVLRLHPDTLAVQAEIPLERKGFGVALDDAADRLYVGNSTDGAITVIDTAANRVIGVVRLAEKTQVTGPDGKVSERYPHSFREMVVDTSRHRLYAPGLNYKDSALYVVDTRSLKVEKVLPGFGFVATGVALDTRTGKLYVSNAQGQVFTVDTTSLAVSKVETAAGDQLINVVWDQRGKRVLATDQGLELFDGIRAKAEGLAGYQRRGTGNQVVALDPATGKALATLPTGQGPVALLLDEQRQRLYVTNRGAGTLSVFDSRSNALLQTVTLPTHPNSLALDAKRNVLYVTVKNGEKDPKGGDESVARIQF